MALTSPWKPVAPGPLMADLERAAGAGDPAGPDAPVARRPGPAAYLRPGRITLDTTPVAVARDGEWIYQEDTLTKAA